MIDTNVLLDVAMQRQPFFTDSAQVVAWAERNPRQAGVAWHSVSNFAYIVKQDARPFLTELLAIVEVAAGTTASVRQALAMPTTDLEDALQVCAALEFGANLIVTRDASDFQKLSIPAITPAEFVARSAAGG